LWTLADDHERARHDYGSEGWGFESLRARATFAQVRALQPLSRRCQIPVMGDPGSQVDSQEPTPRTRAAGCGPGSTPTDGQRVVAKRPTGRRTPGQPAPIRRASRADPGRRGQGAPARQPAIGAVTDCRNDRVLGESATFGRVWCTRSAVRGTSKDPWTRTVARLSSRSFRRHRVRFVAACVLGVVVLMLLGSDLLFEQIMREVSAGAPRVIAVILAICLPCVAVIVDTVWGSGGLSMTAAMATIKARDPVGVLDKVLREHALDGAAPAAVAGTGDHEYGVIQQLRPDIWALSVRTGSRTDATQMLLDQLEGGTPEGAVEELTVGADLLDARELAYEWVRGAVLITPDGSRWARGLAGHGWVQIDRCGIVTFGHDRPDGASPFTPPNVPVLTTLAGRGDSAGLSLFLAYLASVLAVEPNPAYAVAATGDMVGPRFRAVGSVEVKARAAAQAGACFLMLSEDQKLTAPVLIRMPAITKVSGAGPAARAWLTARAVLERAPKPSTRHRSVEVEPPP
jgi:hypothetical protein